MRRSRYRKFKRPFRAVWRVRGGRAKRRLERRSAYARRVLASRGGAAMQAVSIRPDSRQRAGRKPAGSWPHWVGLRFRRRLGGRRGGTRPQRAVRAARGGRAPSPARRASRRGRGWRGWRWVVRCWQHAGELGRRVRQDEVGAVVERAAPFAVDAHGARLRRALVEAQGGNVVGEDASRAIRRRRERGERRQQRGEERPSKLHLQRVRKPNVALILGQVRGSQR
jgi:hypothetical protein